MQHDDSDDSDDDDDDDDVGAAVAAVLLSHDPDKTICYVQLLRHH